jgi:DNA-directed RNA polymerase specialized sigma24 family protein
MVLRAMSDERATPTATGSERVLLGMLALLAADRDERVEGTTPRRTEIILDDAGFSAREIAQLTGKEYEAVRSSIRRAKSSAKKESK